MWSLALYFIVSGGGAFFTLKNSAELRNPSHHEVRWTCLDTAPIFNANTSLRSIFVAAYADRIIQEPFASRVILDIGISSLPD